jgi:hypothetical protein
VQVLRRQGEAAMARRRLKSAQAIQKKRTRRHVCNPKIS